MAADERKDARKDPDYEPLVPTGPCRAHVLELRAAGLPDAEIARLAGLPHNAIWRLMRNARMSPAAARALLAVSAPRCPAGAVSHTIIRAHVKSLTAAGMQLKDIAREAPISLSSLRRYTTGERYWVDARTAAAILALKPRRTYRRDMVDVTGSRRRTRAMVRAGHNIRKIAHALGVRPHTMHDITNSESRQVTRTLAEKITRLYEEWAGLTGTKQVADWAAKRDWPGPQHWHGVDIDDPDATPCGHHDTRPARRGQQPPADPDDLEYGPITKRRPKEYEHANVLHALDGVMFRDELTTAELVETVRILANRGMPDADIYTFLKWVPGYQNKPRKQRADGVVTFRKRHNIPTGSFLAQEEWREAHRQRERHTAPAGLVYRRYEDRPAAHLPREERDARNAAIIARASVA